MVKLCLRALLIAGLCAFTAAPGSSQDWNTAEALPGVDLGGLTRAQTQTALKLLRARDCSCGCGMKVAECRIKDPNCFYSRGLASVIVDAIRAGKSEKEALDAAGASQFAHGPDQRILSDPLPVPIAGAPMIGPKDARITLVEFSDFQCPYCALATPQLRAVLRAYPTQVRLFFKQFPLDIHSQAAFAAKAAVAAQRQGKFWEMHDALFASRKDLSRPTVLGLASALGLDLKRFEADLDSPAVHQAVLRDVEDGNRIGVMSTPTLFLDGRHYNGPIKLEVLKPLLDEALKHPANSASAVPPASATR